jgi:hypothetical protein
MKKIVVVAVLLGVVTALGLGATLALAQGPLPGQPPSAGFGPGWMHGGFGFNADWQTQMQGAVAKALGITLDDLNAQLRAGKTVAQIAQSKNIDLTKLHDDVQAAHKALVQQAVKDGNLTQAQADAMLQRMDTMDQYFDANGGTCPGLTGGAGVGAGRGIMGGTFAPGAGFRGGMTLAPHASAGVSGRWTAPASK